MYKKFTNYSTASLLLRNSFVTTLASGREPRDLSWVELWLYADVAPRTVRKSGANTSLVIFRLCSLLSTFFSQNEDVVSSRI